MGITHTVRGTETILLVEDIQSVRTLIARMLRMQGYTVIETTNGEEALQHVVSQQNVSIEMVVSDVMMPRMGGVELAARLREILPDVKILLISGYSDESLVLEAESHTNLPFLAKPFTAKALGQAVRELLDT